jgi:serine protease Do
LRLKNRGQNPEGPLICRNESGNCETMKFPVALLLILVASVPALAASSQPLSLTSNKHWLTVASSKDLDTAIGIARQFDYEGLVPRVVSSASGWYAVLLGPYTANSIAQLKKDDGNLPELPGDALLSNGSKYVETVWQSTGAARSWTDYGVDKPAHFSAGDLEFEVSMTKKDEDTFSTSIKGSEKGINAFTFISVGSEEFGESGATATLAKLDPASATPQLLVTRYTGGAHCCTKTWIATKLEGSAGWTLVEGANLDGGGYGLEDVDGDGAQELISFDNAFLYAFDSYAGSFAPLHISKLVGSTIEDVSDKPAMRARLTQELAGMEFQAKTNRDLWKSNGFLAGWVANKVRLGEGDGAWAEMLANYDKNSDFGPQECVSGEKVENCPAANLRTIPFPKALAGFLREQTYGELPKVAQ